MFQPLLTLNTAAIPECEDVLSVKRGARILSSSHNSLVSKGDFNLNKCEKQRSLKNALKLLWDNR